MENLKKIWSKHWDLFEKPKLSNTIEGAHEDVETSVVVIGGFTED